MRKMTWTCGLPLRSWRQQASRRPRLRAAELSAPCVIPPAVWSPARPSAPRTPQPTPFAQPKPTCWGSSASRRSNRHLRPCRRARRLHPGTGPGRGRPDGERHVHRCRAAAGGVAAEVTVTAERTQLPLNRVSPTIATTIDARAVIDLPLAEGRNINNLMLTVPNASSTTGQGIYAINGQRPQQQQLHGRRLGQQRCLGDDRDLADRAGSGRRVPGADQSVQRRVRKKLAAARSTSSRGPAPTASAGDVWEYWTGSRFYSLDNIGKGQRPDRAAKFNRHQVGRRPSAARSARQAVLLRPVSGATRSGPRSGRARRCGFRPRRATRALQGVPLGAGQSAASRQAVLQKSSSSRTCTRRIRGSGTSPRPGQRRDDRNGTNQSDDRRSEHLSHVLARADFRPGNADNHHGPLLAERSQGREPGQQLQFGSLFAGNQTLIDTNLAASDTHIFSSRMLNEARVLAGPPRPRFSGERPGQPHGHHHGPVSDRRRCSNFPQSRVTNAYQFSDTVTWTRPRHSLKFGADLRYNDVDNESAINLKGTFTFNNLQDYMNNYAFRPAAGASDGRLRRDPVADVLVRAGRLPRQARPRP